MKAFGIVYSFTLLINYSTEFYVLLAFPKIHYIFVLDKITQIIVSLLEMYQTVVTFHWNTY